MPDATGPRPAPRLSGLDGLRGILALSVLVAHTCGLLAPTSTAPTHIGLLAQAVVVFFALSGFLIFLPFCRALVTGTRLPGLATYGLRRVTRIYPAYVVIFLVANLALSAVFVTNAYDAGALRNDAGTGRITDLGTNLLHVTLLQELVPGQLQTGLNVAWSLSAELGFYLLVPLIALLMTRVLARRPTRSTGARARLMVLPVIGMVAIGLACKTWIAVVDAGSPRNLENLTFGPHPIGVLAESTLTYADVFAAGMFAALVFVVISEGGLSSWTGKALTRWCLGVAAVGALAALVALSRQSAYASALLAVVAGAVLVLVTEPVARGRRSPLGELLDVAPLRYAGKVSLSIYLWHYPVLILVTRWGWFGDDSLLTALTSVLLVLAITVVLSEVTYRLVERPAMRLRANARGTTEAAIAPTSPTGTDAGPR